ncbi:hypothetical protein K474DRAFT_1675434 [Panus rudis PR-1116 ss-1]|nr:hypothetical protein K474DRAFT_1675434 [Panus rudis PR-1116 ss-1]
MKTIHKRLYSAIPRPPTVTAAASTSASRVRSNSASSSSPPSVSPASSISTSRGLHTSSAFPFFDSPPNPHSSGARPPPTNIPARQAKAEVESHAPFSHSGSNSQSGGGGGGGNNSPQSHSQSSNQPPYPLAFTTAQSDASSHYPTVATSHVNIFFPYPNLGPVSSFDTGANDLLESTYTPSKPGTRYHLDVGAYGIPKHSKGVRIAGCDGRGSVPFAGSPVSKDSCSSVQVGEDAYFVRHNAMGVADGVGGWSRLHKPKPDESTASALFARRLMHYCSEEVDAALSTDVDNFCEEDELRDQLKDSLEELTDGLDVLMILEKAYEKTMKAHVKSPEPPEQSSTAPSPSIPPPALQPLMEGSATALLAILDHAPAPTPSSSHLPPPASFFFPRPRVFPLSVPTGTDKHVSPSGHPRAVIRIAHLGDCMGMLIRGEEIVWRTEEMWTHFNTPLQLGPASRTTPRDAKVFTIPVQENDILVLASDGLSDNLWDEEILDEVIRFRRSFLLHPNDGILGTRTLAGMLSEALCSRARVVSERRGNVGLSSSRKKKRRSGAVGVKVPESILEEEEDVYEVPFARRAREEGKVFRGGKMDDISVLIAVVAATEPTGLSAAS